MKADLTRRERVILWAWRWEARRDDLALRLARGYHTLEDLNSYFAVVDRAAAFWRAALERSIPHRRRGALP